MARLIYESVFTSPGLMDQPAWVRLLWIGMVVWADETGYGTATERALLARCCYGLGIRPYRVRNALAMLVQRGCITLEISEGITYYHLTNFERYQQFKRAGRKGRKEERKEGRDVSLRFSRTGSDRNGAGPEICEGCKEPLGSHRRGSKLCLRCDGTSTHV